MYAARYVWGVPFEIPVRGAISPVFADCFLIFKAWEFRGEAGNIFSTEVGCKQPPVRPATEHSAGGKNKQN